MAYAVHTMMAMNKGGAAASKPQVPPASGHDGGHVTPAPPAAATPSALPAAPTLGGAAAPVASADRCALDEPRERGVTPPADSGQLQSFSLFESKDPFHSASGPSSGERWRNVVVGPVARASPAEDAPPAPPTAPPSSAVISVNGVSESVTSGGNFPAANPFFPPSSSSSRSAHRVAESRRRRWLLRERLAHVDAQGEQAGDAREHGGRHAVHARALPAGHGSPRRPARLVVERLDRFHAPTTDSDDDDPTHDHGRLAQGHPERCPTLNRGRAPFSNRPPLPISAACACVAVSVPV